MHESSSAPDTPDRLLDLRQVLELVPASRESLMRWVKLGRFPEPVRLAGQRRVTWRQSDIAAWIRGGAS